MLQFVLLLLLPICCFCDGHCCVLFVFAFVCIVIDIDLMVFVPIVIAILSVPFHLYVGGST